MQLPGLLRMLVLEAAVRAQPVLSLPPLLLLLLLLPITTISPLVHRSTP
jgi:hypothetical protein